LVWLSKRLSTWLSVLIGGLLLGFSTSIYESFLFTALSLALFWLLIIEDRRRALLIKAISSLFLGGLLYFLSNKIFYFFNKNIFQDNHSQLFIYWAQLFTKTVNPAIHYLFPSIILASLCLLAFFGLMLYFWQSKKSLQFILSFLLASSLLSLPIFLGNLASPFRIYFGTFSVVFSGLLYSWTRKAQFRPLVNRVILLLVPVFSVFTFSLILLQNSVFHKDQQIAAILIKDLNTQGITPQNAGQYQIHFYGDITKINNLSYPLQRLSVLTTGFYSTSNFRTQNSPGLGFVDEWGIDFLNTYGYHFKTMSPANMTNVPKANFPDPTYLMIDESRHTVVVRWSNLP